MNNPDSTSILWNKAARNGIILGLFTAVCRMAAQGVSLSGASAGSAVLNSIIWILQTGGCFWMMKFFLERLVSCHEGVTNRDTSRYGMMLALTSSIIFSAAMLFDIIYIAPEAVEKQMDLFYQLYGPAMDSNTRSVLKTIEDNYPMIMFFSTLVYSCLYGIVLSAILSLSIPKRNPFEKFMDKQEN